MSALDIQIGGGHYKGMKIQPMEYSMANGLDACQHTAIKYISRFRDKGGIQDLEKAKHCIDMLIEFEQKRLGEETVDAIVKDLAQGSKFGEKLIEACEQVNGQMAAESAPKGATHIWSVCGQFAKRAGGENWALWQNEEWIFIGAELKGEMLPLVQPEQDPYGPRDAEGWYSWKGDETMRPAGKVEVITRGGFRGAVKANEVVWGHGAPTSFDIVKWRPAQ